MKRLLLPLLLLLSLATLADAQNYSHRRVLEAASGGAARSGMYLNLAATGQVAIGYVASEGLVLVAGFYGGYESPTVGPCCGRYTSGFTGNTNCDVDGKRNLEDVVMLIDRIWLSKQALCCEANGNVDGDVESKMNLSDIVGLIDHIWISKVETAACE